jgi:hypothetical protein
MMVIRVIYTMWMIIYVLVEKSFLKDLKWDDRVSKIGGIAFLNLIFLFFSVTYYLEMFLGTNNTAKFFSIDFPLYGVGVGLSFVVMIISLILFSFLNKKDKRKSFRIALKIWSPINRISSIVIQILIFIVAAYSFKILVDEMLGIS